VLTEVQSSEVTKASVIISLSYKSIFVTCSIVVEDACVGVTIAYVLAALLLC
jgi:hypothetical protein